MSKQGFVVTAAGRSLFAKLVATLQPVHFTRVMCGTGKLADDADMQIKWRYFLKTLGNPEIHFSEVIRGIQQFLLPVWEAIVTEDELLCCWSAEASAWHPTVH